MANHGDRQGVSVRAFAKSIGVTENAVRSRIKRGMKVAEAVHPDGSLDPDLARAYWFTDLNAANVRGVKQRQSAIHSAAQEAVDLNRVKAEREIIAMRREKINLAKEEGSTIDRDDVRRGLVTFGRLYRDAVLNFASRQGPELAAKWGVEARVVVGDLEAALRTMLAELVKEPLPKQLAEDDTAE